MKMVESQNDKIENLFELGNQLLSDGHMNLDGVKECMENTLRIRDELENDAVEREKLLTNAAALANFQTDVEEVCYMYPLFFRVCGSGAILSRDIYELCLISLVIQKIIFLISTGHQRKNNCFLELYFKLSDLIIKFFSILAWTNLCLLNTYIHNLYL